MNLSEPFIRRPVMTCIVMLALLIFGLMAYDRLPVSDLPNVDYPTITVYAGLPGASPETMSNTVATPLEKAFMTISGLQTVTSSNTLGSTSIILQFELSKNIDTAAQDVQAAISKTLPLLPSNLPTNPSYQKVNPSQSAIIYLVLTSDTLNLAELYNYANINVGQRLSMIPGVAQVQTYGSPYAVRIQVDPGAMADRLVDLNAVSVAINAGNPHLATGGLQGPYRRLSIQAAGQLLTAAAYAPLVVAYRNGTPIRIKDIGRVVDSLSDTSFNMRYISKNFDKPTVLLAVSRQPGANTVKVAEAVQAALPSIQKDLPASLTLKILFDKSVGINESVNDVKFNLVLAFILVVTVIFLYLGKITDTVIPSIVLPMSIIGTFSIMYLLDFSIDNLSLLALTLSIGFIIDDAIVVLENIVRHTELGEVPYQAALIGSRQISVTVFTMTIALASVFIPMLFMSGLLGRLFNEFAVTIVIAILFSGFLSLSLTPMLCSRFVPRREPGKADRKKNISDHMNSSLLNLYKKSLTHTLKHPKTCIGVGLLCLAATITVFELIQTDFMPSDDIGFILGYSEMPEGTSSTYMIQHQRQVSDIIRKDPAIEDYVSLGAFPNRNEGIFFIRLKPANERKPMKDILADLIPKVSTVPGINTFLNSVPLINLSVGATGKGNYQYTLQSLNPRLLYKNADTMLQKIKSLPGFTNVSSNLKLQNPQLNVEIYRDQAATYGLTANDVETALQLAYSGGKVSTIETPSAQYDVILELLPEYQESSSALNTIYIKSPLTSEMVPLSSLAKWSESVGPAEVDHINQFPAVTISFSLQSGIPLGTAVARLNNAAQTTLPPQVTGKVSGSAEAFEQTMADFVFLTLVAILVIYMVLGVLYESFILPFTILSALPIAGIGALITLVIFKEPLSLYAFVGLILLLGIVQKNGIMMVDHANHVLKMPGKTAEEAIYEACTVRFRPIIMTTLAAIMGAMPIALGIGAGAEARKPLGLVIVGGLIFSQLLTLYITPVVFLYFEKLREYMQKRFKTIHITHHE